MLTSGGLRLVALDDITPNTYAWAVLAVQHQRFSDLGPTLRDWIGDGVIYDVRGQLGDWADGRL